MSPLVVLHAAVFASVPCDPVQFCRLMRVVAVRLQSPRARSDDRSQLGYAGWIVIVSAPLGGSVSAR
jgi:hypothetical protein